MLCDAAVTRQMQVRCTGGQDYEYSSRLDWKQPLIGIVGRGVERVSGLNYGPIRRESNLDAGQGFAVKRQSSIHIKLRWNNGARDSKEDSVKSAVWQM